MTTADLRWIASDGRPPRIVWYEITKYAVLIATETSIYRMVYSANGELIGAMWHTGNAWIALTMQNVPGLIADLAETLARARTAT